MKEVSKAKAVRADNQGQEVLLKGEPKKPKREVPKQRESPRKNSKGVNHPSDRDEDKYHSIIYSNLKQTTWQKKVLASKAKEAKAANQAQEVLPKSEPKRAVVRPEDLQSMKMKKEDHQAEEVTNDVYFFIHLKTKQ